MSNNYPPHPNHSPYSQENQPVYDSNTGNTTTSSSNTQRQIRVFLIAAILLTSFLLLSKFIYTHNNHTSTPQYQADSNPEYLPETSTTSSPEETTYLSPPTSDIEHQEYAITNELSPSTIEKTQILEKTATITVSTTSVSTEKNIPTSAYTSATPSKFISQPPLTDKGWTFILAAQCNDGDPWEYAATDEQNYVIICHSSRTGNRYYRSLYKGKTASFAVTEYGYKNYTIEPGDGMVITIQGNILRIYDPNGKYLSGTTFSTVET